MTLGQVWEYGILGFKEKELLEQGSLPAILLLGLICVVIGYFIGSLNFGVIISRIYGQDIREKGSGNAGATNMMRVYGKKASGLTLACDALKTVIAVLLARIFVLGYIGAYLAGIFAIVGHAWPVYFGFKGGKGVAAISAFCLITEPWIFLIELAIFIIILFSFKMVSLGSISIAFIFPFMVFFFRGMGVHIALAILAAGLVIFLHRQNIVRIFTNTEHKFNLGKKKKTTVVVEETQANDAEINPASIQTEENHNEEN